MGGRGETLPRWAGPAGRPIPRVEGGWWGGRGRALQAPPPPPFFLPGAEKGGGGCKDGADAGGGGGRRRRRSSSDDDARPGHTARAGPGLDSHSLNHSFARPPARSERRGGREGEKKPRAATASGGSAARTRTTRAPRRPLSSQQVRRRRLRGRAEGGKRPPRVWRWRRGLPGLPRLLAGLRDLVVGGGGGASASSSGGLPSAPPRAHTLSRSRSALTAMAAASGTQQRHWPGPPHVGRSARRGGREGTAQASWLAGAHAPTHSRTHGAGREQGARLASRPLGALRSWRRFLPGAPAAVPPSPQRNAQKPRQAHSFFFFFP